MRVGNTYKDHGHWGRKAVWLSLAVLLFVPHVVCTGASWLDGRIMAAGSKLHRWSHPCLYARHMPRKDRKD